MKNLLHRHYPLWVLMSLAFTIVTSLTLPTIAGLFTTRLTDSMRAEQTGHLNEGLKRLIASDFDTAELQDVENQGTHVLVFDERSQTIRFRSGGSTHVTNIGEEPAPDTAARPTPMEEAAVLYGLVLKWLGGNEGRFFITDMGTPPNVDGSNLECKELYLCGRSGSMVFCLNLPVEAANNAVKSAVDFTQKVSLGAWVLFVGIFVHSAQQISKRQRTIADIASRLARLDFSARCPAAFSKELNDLRMSINTMANALEEHIDALQRTNKKLHAELSERIRQQKIASDLIANLAHDLKTPVAIVSGYAEAITEGMARTPEKQMEYCENILKESDRMQAIVTRILALGRMESGETPLKRVNFDVAAVLDDILNLFQRELERRELNLSCLMQRPCPVYSDFECVRQSLINYVQNAIYHINNGNRIEVFTQDLGDRIRVRVLNSSAPIPEEEARKIWDKLYRLDPSRQRNHGEMGLGLAIVKGNMDRLGHAFGVENVPEFPGVCFWLELPKAEREQA